MVDQCLTWKSPIGHLALLGGESGLRHIFFWNIPGNAPDLECLCPGAGPGSLVEDALSQIREYINGERQTFSIPLDTGYLSCFGRQVVENLMEVPYGEIITYRDLAVRSGSPRASRAVGRLMAANPLPLVIPCHRVVGSGGRLTGYSGGDGIPTKKWLIEHEQKCKDEKNKKRIKSA